MKKATFATVSLLIGVSFFSGYQLGRKTPSTTERQNHDALQAELAETLDKLHELESREPQRKEGAVYPPNQTPFATALPAPARSPQQFTRLFRQSVDFKTIAEQQALRKAEQYAQRLGLDPQQTQRLSEILAFRIASFAEMVSADDTGMTIVSSDKAVTQADIDDLAREIMTDEQYEDYQQLRNDEEVARNEMFAQARLSGIAPQLGLNEEQKDALYAVYYQQAQEQSHRSAGEKNEAMNRDSKARIKEILTGDQFDLYEKLEAERSTVATGIYLSP